MIQIIKEAGKRHDEVEGMGELLEGFTALQSIILIIDTLPISLDVIRQGLLTVISLTSLRRSEAENFVNLIQSLIATRLIARVSSKDEREEI